MKCPKCKGCEMRLWKSEPTGEESRIDTWRCPDGNCGAQITVRRGSHGDAPGALPARQGDGLAHGYDRAGALAGNRGGPDRSADDT